MNRTGTMTNQEALDKIEGLLRARKDKDPKARAAWEAITVPGPINRAEARIDVVPRDISDWPEGAVWGLLERDICDTMDWDTDYWPQGPTAWRTRIQRGTPWHTGATRNEALAAALIAALEARVKNG